VSQGVEPEAPPPHPLPRVPRARTVEATAPGPRLDRLPVPVARRVEAALAVASVLGVLRQKERQPLAPNAPAGGKLMCCRGHLVRRAMVLAALLLLGQVVATFVNARREQAQAQRAQAAAMKAAADAQAAALRNP
jgi:hypothetical protein